VLYLAIYSTVTDGKKLEVLMLSQYFHRYYILSLTSKGFSIFSQRSRMSHSSVQYIMNRCVTDQCREFMSQMQTFHLIILYSRPQT
jgi:polyphosphate kinase 2 (PPK2 family)